MKINITMHFKEFKNNPAQSWLVGNSAWKSDPGKRISTGGMLETIEKAIGHTIELMEEGETLTVTLDVSSK